MTKEQRREIILTKPIFPLLVRMAIPTIIGMLVTMIYNLTDTFFIGQLGNKSMTAAIGIAFSFVSFIQALGFWFGYGSGNAMSRSLGAKQDDEAAILSSTGIVLALVTGTILSLTMLFSVERIAAFLGGNASDSLLNYSTQYLRVMICTVPFSLYATTLYNQMRLCGNVKDGMIGLMTGMLCNMILDPIFIFTCKMGFIGAGWATFAGQALGAVILTILSMHNGNIPVRLHRVSLRNGRLYHILVGGAPNFSRQGITSVAAILLNIQAANYGEETIAALTIAGRVAALFYMVMIGWGQGFQPICAMNYGAGKYDRVKKALKLSTAIGTIFLIAAAFVLAIFAEPLSSIFSKNSEVIALCTRILRLQCISLPFMGVYALSSMFTQNIGKYFTALLISISRQGLFYIPLLYLLPPLFAAAGLDAMTGLFCVQPAADIASFVFGGSVMLWCLRRIQVRSFHGPFL